MEVEINIDEHNFAVEISGDKQRIHKYKDIASKFLGEEGLVVQGVHLIALLESKYSPIADHYPLKLENMGFESPIGIKDKVKLNYDFVPMKKGEQPFYLYNLTIREGEKKCLIGNVYTTKDYEVFLDVMSREKNFHNIFCLNKEKERKEIGEVVMNEKLMSDYLKVMHIDKEKYCDKYRNNFPGMFLAYLSAAKIVNSMGNLEEKTYAFRKFTNELYSPVIDGNKTKILLNKREKRGFNMLDILMTGENGRAMSGSEAVLLAI